MLLLLPLLAACGSPGSKAHNRTPEVQARFDEAVKNGQIRLGMSQDEVRKAIGRPKRTGREKRGKEYLDTWYYPGSAVFFDAAGYVIDIEGMAIR